MQVLNKKKTNILDFLRGRIIYIADNEEVDRKTFLTKTGLKKGIFDYKDIFRAVGSDKLSNILDSYPDTNLNWLLTGEGDMKNNISNQKKDSNPIIKELTTSNNKIDRGIPLIPTDAMAGLSSGTVSISEDDIMQYYNVPDFVDVDFMIRVKGSSMYPKYNSGDVVACRMINSSSFLQWNKVHVIATKEQGVLIKRLKKSKDNECLKAISDNMSYDAFEIPKEEILNIALVVGVIRLE